MLSDRTVNWIAGAVTAVWMVTVVLDATLSGYVVPYAVHGIMGLVAGGAFGEKYVRRAGRLLDRDVERQTADEEAG